MPEQAQQHENRLEDYDIKRYRSHRDTTYIVKIYPYYYYNQDKEWNCTEKTTYGIIEDCEASKDILKDLREIEESFKSENEGRVEIFLRGNAGYKVDVNAVVFNRTTLKPPFQYYPATGVSENGKCDKRKAKGQNTNKLLVWHRVYYWREEQKELDTGAVSARKMITYPYGNDDNSGTAEVESDGDSDGDVDGDGDGN
jgi:hypothetical protein